MESRHARNLVDCICAMLASRVARVSEGETHTTALAIPQVRIRFQIAPGTGTGLGIAAVPYQIFSGTTEVSQGTTDPNGEISIPVPLIQAGNCAVRAFGTDFPVTLLSAWDDISTALGQQQRLDHLGYVTGFLFDAGTSADPATSRAFQAINAFQWDQDIRVDGICGPVTRGKLRTANGGV